MNFGLDLGMKVEQIDRSYWLFIALRLWVET